MYEIICSPYIVFQEAYIGETSQPLQHSLRQHCRSSYNRNDSEVSTYMTWSEHQIDVSNVTIMNRENNWFERGVKEAVWVRTESRSLDSNGSTRITLSHSWDRSIDTTQLFSISKRSGSKISTGRQHQHQLSKQP